jgi:hypothetical protein
MPPTPWFFLVHVRERKGFGWRGDGGDGGDDDDGDDWVVARLGLFFFFSARARNWLRAACFPSLLPIFSPSPLSSSQPHPPLTTSSTTTTTTTQITHLLGWGTRAQRERERRKNNPCFTEREEK